MYHSVFISYCSKDKLIANTICSALETASIKCWIGPRDIRVSQNWAESITEAIRSSKAFVLICSKDTYQAKDVANEVVLAMNMEVTIIPVIIDGSHPSGIFKYYLSGSSWLELTNPPDEIQISKLLKHTEALLE